MDQNGPKLTKMDHFLVHFPDPPILAFFDFIFFSDFPCFFDRFPFLSMDFRGSAKRITLVFWGVSLAFFQKKQGLEGQGLVSRMLKSSWE